MPKIIIIQREYPKFLNTQNKNTYFIEKLYNYTKKKVSIDNNFIDFKKANQETKKAFITTNKIFKVNDLISIRFWSGIKYKSPQIEVMNDIPIKFIIDMEFKLINNNFSITINNNTYPNNKGEKDYDTINKIAKSCGLSYINFINWYSNYISKTRTLKCYLIVI